MSLFLKHFSINPKTVVFTRQFPEKVALILEHLSGYLQLIPKALEWTNGNNLII